MMTRCLEGITEKFERFQRVELARARLVQDIEHVLGVVETILPEVFHSHADLRFGKIRTKVERAAEIGERVGMLAEVRERRAKIGKGLRVGGEFLRDFFFEFISASGLMEGEELLV